MLSIEQLIQEVLSLPSESRAFLAEKLLESLEFDIDPMVEAGWMTEAKRRRDEIRSGAVEPIPGDEALAQSRRLLEQ
ncbi:MAG: addiction module protein [Nostoc sp. NOS(2021)]|uniref:addiction module protein n=1 Tax=Nostoc sp. NOS(2021) TaxID=2815407 RepID=UPI0025CC66F8|nr:addiction module protein [Nostoc sp. NOS(2021)]MBN3895900.1 addiction module protein [Nostoc sp. NOS(2021)]